MSKPGRSELMAHQRRLFSVITDDQTQIKRSDLWRHVLSSSTKPATQRVGCIVPPSSRRT
jgi:hypothetical protein